MMCLKILVSCCDAFTPLNCSLLVGRGFGDKPRHYPGAGVRAEEALAHVCRRTGQVPAGQHAWRHFWGHPPQSHSQDIWRQSSRHHWWTEEEPCRLSPYCTEKVCGQKEQSSHSSHWLTSYIFSQWWHFIYTTVLLNLIGVLYFF